MEALVLVAALAAVVAVGAAGITVSASAEARKERRAVDRDRLALNRQFTYNHPRSFR